MSQIEPRVNRSALSQKRNRWTSVLSWGTFVLAFASFSAIWYNLQGDVNAAQSPAAITTTDNSSNQGAGANSGSSADNQYNQSNPYTYNSGSDPFAGSGGQVSPGRSSGGGFRSRAS